MPKKKNIKKKGKPKFVNFQDTILNLQKFWGNYGCVILQPYDMEVGAGTFHPATTLRSLGTTPWKAAYVQPSRRPTDGRYGKNPNRLQHYYQFVWCDGMEITQFTYFQQMAGIECKPVSVELTYGLERICMFRQKKNNVFDLIWNNAGIKYKNVFHQAEKEYSAYNFEYANTEHLLKNFEIAENECKFLLEKKLPLPAYDQCLKASHVFNLLDARGVIGVAQRTEYISRIRELAKGSGEAWLESQK